MSKREREPWQTDPGRLKIVFNVVLKRIWETWSSLEMKGTPFKNLDDIRDLEMTTVEIMNFTFDVAWARGVSEALGWSLMRPGPKEWSPNDWR